MKCFHHNDIDGKAAGAIVARKTGNYNKADYIIYDYSKPIPTELIEEGETVYFVDLSFMEILKTYPEYEKVKGIRKEGISGAALTYMYLFHCEFDDIPMFLKYISDFDCWQFKLEDTLFFKYALEATDYEALDIIWNQLFRAEYSASNGLLDKMIESGKAISKYVEKEYEQYRKAYAYESRIDGVKCLVVNRRCNSLIFGDLIKDYPIVAIWVFDGEKYKYSIYSDKPDIDCSKIAERYGGGGHKGASGFVSEKMIFNKVK